MRFLDPRGDLDALPHARTYAEEVAIALSAIDTVLHGEKAVYASSELTTGKRLYALLASHGARSREELRDRMGPDHYRRQVWNPYVAEALALAEALRRRLGGALVLTPAPFEAPGWSQPEYLAFWETLIRTRFRAVYFSTEWEYSNGCTFELAVARSAGLETFDELGRPLDAATAAAKIRAAIADLAAQGFPTAGLEENLARLEAVVPLENRRN